MWQCDCDGESHLKKDSSGTPEAQQNRIALKHPIQVLLNIEVPTCPWRAFYDPLVKEVISVYWAKEGGNLGAVIGQDAPGILVDAIGVFVRALEMTKGEDRKIAEEERKRRNETEKALRSI